MVTSKYSIEDRQIVRSWAGSGTCEMFHETRDGRVWRSDLLPSDGTNQTCPPTYGRIIDGHIL